jgi:hypothetical protein
MRTEELIRTLAADSLPAKGPGRLLAVGLPLALAASVGLMLVTLGLRVDLAMAVADPVSAMRFVLTGALLAAGLAAALRASRPEAGRRVPLWPFGAVAAVAAALWLGTLAATPSGSVGMAIVGKTAVYCLVSIPLLSVPPVALLLWALRRGATTTPGLTGALAGLAGAGGAAAVYALHCTEDSPLFYVTWYGLAILAVTLAAALIGRRLLRW